jgi:hypothetical protein
MKCYITCPSFSHSQNDDITYYAVKNVQIRCNKLMITANYRNEKAKHTQSKINYSCANNHETAANYKIQVIMKALPFSGYCFIHFLSVVVPQIHDERLPHPRSVCPSVCIHWCNRYNISRLKSHRNLLSVYQ